MKVKYCPRCPFYSHQFTKVLTHIGLMHSAEPNFRVFCGIGGCANSYRNFSSYKSHLYRCHRSLLEENGSHLQPRSSEPRSSADHAKPLTEDRPQPVDDMCTDSGGYQNPGTSGDRSPHHSTETRRNDFATFLLQAKTAIWNFFFHATEQHDLPHSVVERLFSELELVFEAVMKAYAGQIAQAVKAPETANELDQLLECSFVPELFKGVDKKRAREQYVRETFPFVEPQEHVLGQNAKYHYVPLPKLLSVLCNIPDIAANLATPQVEEDAPSILKDYTDGLLYREHLRALLPEESSHTIFILLYTDEIEVVNPLGAKRGLHKLLAVYCSLLNIHPKYRSQLHSIYLVMLVKYVHVQSYGLDTVLQPVVDDLRQLCDQGLRFNFQGAEKHARVLLFSFCGDNLSMNRLGGFSCGFSGGRVCRFCMVSAKQLALKTSEHLCQLRTAARHQVHLQSVAANSKANKRLYGVKEASVLLQLPYFDVTRQLPPDIMHDMLEGGAECVLRQVLRSLMDQGFLSRRDLDAVSSFEYGPNDSKNKPVQVNISFLTSQAALKGTASSKWCLLRFLPLILGNQIPQENGDWELLLQYREIIDIVFAPEMPAERLAYLNVLVQTFLEEFAERYGSKKVTPKLHYMVHYARFVQESGPLKQFWSMRFEAKHQYCKKLATCVKNFKNLTYTLSMRHQLKQSHQLHSFQLYEGLETGKSSAVDWATLPPCAQEALPTTVHEVKQATLDHCKYRQGSVLVGQAGDTPEFYEIERLLVANGRLFVLARILLVSHFDRHRFCYYLKRSEQQLYEAGEQFKHCLLDLYNGCVVVPKWELL